MLAVIDMSGQLLISQDDGASWAAGVEEPRLAGPSGLYIC